MELRTIAIALAVLSMSGTAFARGNQATNSAASSDHAYSAQQPSNAMSTQQPANAMSSSQDLSQPQAASTEKDPTLVRSAQQALKQKGFDAGAVDGQVGPSTKSAIRDFQQAQGLPQSGDLDQQTLSALGVNQNQAAAQDHASGSSAAPAAGTTTQSTTGNATMPANTSASYTK